MRITIFLIIISLVISCGDNNPQLSKKEMEWKIYNRTVDTDDPNYPLEIIEDGYKIIRAYHKDASKIGYVEFPAKDEVEWGWKSTVRNKSNKRLKVTVTYILKDKDRFTITSDKDYEYADPGDTVTIRSTSSMNFQNVKRVYSSSGSISYYEQ
ncbi:MAG: hypothetical protein ISS29_09230 [Candidatus Marinimicrobia bacterium]|nr:hypothetical protein [Candidatus Neomarinimicrobiota bacterium]